jgi:hypothetical protein
VGNNFWTNSGMRIFTLTLLVFFSCSHLDKGTEGKVDKILTSPNFEFFTYQANCIYPDRAVLTKDNVENLTFTTAADSSLTVTYKFDNDREQKIKQIIKNGYNTDTPNDTGPGNMNRHYWLCSSIDTLHFFNSDADLFDMFLNIGGQSITDDIYKNR